MATENVNRPKHYNGIPGIECIDVVRHFDFNLGNAIKYIWRAGLKKDKGRSLKDKKIEDLEKAIWYLEDEINQLKIDEVRNGNS